MAWQDFISAVNGGETGTYDPSAAGMGSAGGGWTEPLLTKLLRSGALSNGISGPPPESARINAAPPAPPPIPPPSIPTQQDLPQSQNLMPGRVLAQLPNTQPIPAPGGEMSLHQAGLSLLHQPQPGTPFAALRAAAGGGAPAQSTDVGSPMQPQTRAQVGSDLQQQINELKSNPDFQRYAPQSTKPGFYDNLMRFGLAAMAAGGKPGSTLLGALGEAGLSTYDASQKAGQTDIDNAMAARRLGHGSQDQISKAYERLESLRVKEQQGIATQADRQEKLRLEAQTAAWQNQSRMDANDTRRDSNDIRADANQNAKATRDAAQADREQRTAETAQRDAASFYQRRRDVVEKTNPLGMDEAGEAKLMAQTARAYPGSNYDREWTSLKSGYLDNARRFIQTYPAQKSQAHQMLQKMGIDPREL